MTPRDAGIAWPRKTRELQHSHFDSTIWNDFQYRDDDIIIATYAKSGTTWLQQIISQLIFNGAEGLPVAEMSPWVDMLLPPKEVKLAEIEAQTHRRFLKTHLPLDALVYEPTAKYIYVARDGRDVLWSYYNHHSNQNQEIMDALNGMKKPEIEAFMPADLDIHNYYRRWVERDGYPIWSFWENIASWWAARDVPNLMLLHFSNLKEDLPGQIRKIAEFLDIEINEAKWQDILMHCSFDYMKENAVQTVPLGGAPWKGGAKTFIHKGTNGRWHDILSQKKCEEYENLATLKLGPDCAHWLATGEMKK